MTLAEFQALLARVTYKPGWALDALASPDPEYVLLRVAFTVPDATGRQAGAMPLRIKYPLLAAELALLEEEHALEFVQRCIMEMERHEFREWFQLDGVPVFPAHGPGGELL